MNHKTERIEIINTSPGTRRFININTWRNNKENNNNNQEENNNNNNKRVYIQGSLHADEIPGLLVCNHLSKLLDEAASRGEIEGEIIIVPFANPIGLSQQILGHHVGRFCLESGINFNRSWFDCTEEVSREIEGKLTSDPNENVRIIREELIRQIDKKSAIDEDVVLKKTLLRISSISDIVLDLHCDGEAILHMYTHDRLWPNLSDLSEELGSKCQLLDSNSGGNCFDEANCNLWSNLADRFPSYPIPMACEATTIELRGESDVYDNIALNDAYSIYRFLQRRNIISITSSSPSSTYTTSSPPSPLSLLSLTVRQATPLSGVDMIKAEKCGVVAWRVHPGDEVKEGDILGEIVDIDDLEAPRVPIRTSTSGIVFGRRGHKLVRPGQIIIKVSGIQPLEWRKGYMLTA
mmetsp:Transcript_14197/g.14827  ORF Transcript_14197/g.14827 Transcript_14197/m.14827 type:complete len:407 (-) Transcript_14197:52-1272(-)